ncbi:amidase [Micromonospora sp. ATCC 39149]|uniref:Amidase n=1 Tax=Micromonospora carbonacea TaxID=47853 RepID=A0A7D6CGR4_9ACTN|nr:amidase [Micromonospora sp. ATCC 39149]QLK01141.1 amidase [Micromonospora carbonacea]
MDTAAPEDTAAPDDPAASGESAAPWAAVELAELVNAGRLRPLEVVEAALARIGSADAALRAFRETWPERARHAARELERSLAAGPLPLAGVPLGVKATEGVDSPQARRLAAAGCIPIGATAVPRGTPWQTWGHTDRGPTTNPWRADRTPGGSSAGSAAAVAAGLVPLATGNDGAGSVRIPAAWCGVVGIKVTNGRLPARDAAGLNAPGPLARTVVDAAAYLDAVLGTRLAGHLDPARGGPLRAVWSATLGYAEVAPAVVGPAVAAADRLADAGILRWVEHDLVLADPAPAWRALRAPGGRAATATVRAGNDARLARLFAAADVLLTPTTPDPAHGHAGPGDRMSVALTWAFNVSGHPAASVPAGFAPDGTPVGLQIVAPHHHEHLLIRTAAALEALRPWPPPGPGQAGPGQAGPNKPADRRGGAE